MIKYSLILLVGVIVHMGSTVYGQKESENSNACIFIPNNISVRCDHYNKDFTLKEDENYEIEFSYMDSSGNLTPWTGERIQFTKPTAENSVKDH
jgi:hypothetical protein